MDTDGRPDLNGGPYLFLIDVWRKIAGKADETR